MTCALKLSTTALIEAAVRGRVAAQGDERKREGPRPNFDTVPPSSHGNHLIFQHGSTRNVI